MSHLRHVARAGVPLTALVADLAPDIDAVVLVEGASDRHAIETLARRRRCDLAGTGIAVVDMGGVTNTFRYLERFGPHGAALRLAGLCDAGEERVVRRALERAGMGVHPDRESMATVGFHVCDADLEDELIRALGTDAVEDVVRAAGELVPWQTFQRQPEQRGRDPHAQLRRFMGTKSGRKHRYGTLLVEALDLGRVPATLDAVLDAVLAGC